MEQHFLTEQEIRTQAPSIFQTHANPYTTSGKYKQITTAHMIDALHDLDWHPVKVQQVKARKEHTMGYQKHVVEFENPTLSDSSFVEVGDDLNPRIVLTNSHDGFNAFQFRFGIYRLVCSNGLIVPKAEFGKFRILHKGQIQMSEVEQGVYEYVENITPIVGKIQTFKGIELDARTRTNFGKRALEMRYGSFEDSPMEIAEVLTPRYEGDEKHDLWTVFNVIQGNLMYPERHEIHSKPGSKRRVKGFKGIDSAINFNSKLWEMMMFYSTIVK